MGTATTRLATPISRSEPPPSTPNFDPQYGFHDGREKRVMIATEEEMRAAKVPKHFKDYCAHEYIKFLSCQRKEYPFVYNCAHEKHMHHSCQYDDYILRMKEYERERRLLARQKKKQAAQAE